jgi:hypothetical protein
MPARLCLELLPRCFPGYFGGLGKQKTPRRVFLKLLISLASTGAGEANRTPDPNLGKDFALTTSLCNPFGGDRV